MGGVQPTSVNVVGDKRMSKSSLLYHSLRLGSTESCFSMETGLEKPLEGSTASSQSFLGRYQAMETAGSATRSLPG